MGKRLEDMTEPEIGELMAAMGNQITAVCAVLGVQRPLFTLLLFNDPAIAQYMSNCERSPMIRALRETADRLEAREDVTRGPATN